MNKRKKYTVLILLMFLLSGCNGMSAETDTIVSIEETTALETIEESSVEIKEDEWKTESDEEVESAKYRSNGIIEVSIERIENPIKNEDGEVIAIVYYDKPVVSGDSEEAKKINAFFDEEEENFRKGSGRLTLERDN